MLMRLKATKKCSVDTQQMKINANDMASGSGAEKQQSDDNLKPIIEAMRKASRPCHSKVVSMNSAIRHYWITGVYGTHMRFAIGVSISDSITEMIWDPFYK